MAETRGADLAEQFSSFDGVKIFYQLWRGESELPPVVLCHGFAASGMTNWVGPGIVAELLARGRTVLVVDARGHGQSDKPHDPGCYGERNMARDLAAVLDHLHFDGIDLVGYSMGAVIALLFASEYSQVRRLVVGGVGDGVVELGGVDTRILPGKHLAAGLREDDPANIQHAEAAGFRTFAEALGNDRLALAAQADALHCTPIALDQIRCPTLLLAGDKDPLAARPQRLQAAIAGAELKVLPGDHLSVVSESEFLQQLSGFLSH